MGKKYISVFCILGMVQNKTLTLHLCKGLIVLSLMQFMDSAVISRSMLHRDPLKPAPHMFKHS